MGRNLAQNGEDRHSRGPLLEHLEPRLLLDGAGPQITDAAPTGVVQYADSIDLTFNEPINPATLTADDVRIIPSVPSVLGAYHTTGYAEEVVVVGSLAYLVDEYAGLYILDVSDPSNPQQIGYYNTPGEARDLAISGDYAYVADLKAGLTILDVSDPASPAHVGSFATDRARAICVEGTVAYLSDPGHTAYGLYVLDVSDPSAPVQMGYTNNGGGGLRPDNSCRRSLSSPAGQPDDPSPGLLSKDVRLALDGLVQTQPPARGGQSNRVADFRLYRDKMVHRPCSPSL